MPEIWHNKRQKSIFFETNKLIRPKWSTLFFYKQLAIIGRGWAKYHDLSVASRSIICQSPRLRQITDLRDTDGSRYFAITEFNYCFIIQSPSFFLMNIFGKRSDLLFFSRKNDWKKEESVVSFTHEQNIICSRTQLDDIAHEQTIILRQLFRCLVVGFRLIKWKKNSH